MNLLEVYTPELDTFVRYKIMDPDDISAFVDAHKDMEKDDYVRVVLDTLVFNLRSEISDVLRHLSKDFARRVLGQIYNGCIMLNPGLDTDEWLKLANPSTEIQQNDAPPTPEDPPPVIEPEEDLPKPRPRKKPKPKLITRARFLGLDGYLRNNIIGQDEAIESVVGALKRSIAGIADDNRPLGVFLFAGASGVGKTELAKQLHGYLFGEEFDLVRIDCGEYQHKHENQKLLGSPPGYIGHDEGGHLTNQMKKNSHTVVLLDEVEKAHPDIWNTFLRVFDEGMITDGGGAEISFRDSIIIMTTNLGNKEAVSSLLDGGLGFGAAVDVDLKNAKAPPRAVVDKYAKKAIRKSFRPEFLNRIDKVVVFNHLGGDDLSKIAELELHKLEAKLTKRGITLSYDDTVLAQMVSEGVNPIEGARGLSRVRRDHIEDVISDALLASARRLPRGTLLSLSFDAGKFVVDVKRPARKKRAKATE